MADNQNTRFELAPGTQVREEDFGLLFYRKEGPRLYFLSCGDYLQTNFFGSQVGLADWFNERAGKRASTKVFTELSESLKKLADKGVIIGR
jgi:putative mycofactocin binding protein MftB